MSTIDGGAALVRVLQAAGVDTVFTLHGGHLDAIYQAALDQGLRLIDTRHEQAAGHAADGWARTTGRLGVAMVTAGPGVTDVVTAVANAYLDCIPILIIGGRSPLIDDERLPLQGGFSQVDLMRPVTKWSVCVNQLQRLPDLAAQAIRIATSGRPGPVFLEVPADVLFGRIEAARLALPERLPHVEPCAPAPASVDRALTLSAAARPLIMAGGGVWFSGGAPDLRTFAERTRIPVLANGRARACLPEGHPLSGGGFATLASVAPDQRPDVVLLLGARLGLFTGGTQRPFIPADATVIQVDVEAEEIGRNRSIDVGIQADCALTLQAMADVAGRFAWREHDAWIHDLRAARGIMARAFADAVTSDARPVHPYRLAHEVAAALDRDDDVVVADGGETAFWAESATAVQRPGRWLSHGYLGCLGTGLPFAIAARAAHPDSRVLCVTGDGSVGLNFAEFDTMMRHRLPVVVVVSNDQQWGMSKHGQELMYGKGRTVVSELGPVRYDLAAAGFGCYSELVEDPSEIRPAIERAFGSGRAACINVLTDPEVIAPVTLAMVGRSAAPARPGVVNMPYYGERDVS